MDQLPQNSRILLHAIELEIDADGDASFDPLDMDGNSDGQYLDHSWLEENPDKWQRLLVEPPEGSVVLGVDGRAWQRIGRNWVAPGSITGWPYLVKTHGPVTTIHQPEVEKS